MVRWLQLEANPEVLGEYAEGLLGDGGGGLHAANGNVLAFADIISTERDVLAAIYGQEWLACCQGIILVAPIAALNAAFQGTHVLAARGTSYLFIKQYIDNACGAIAMLHLLGNLKGGDAGPASGSGPPSFRPVLRHLCSLSTPEDRGHWLETSEEMATLHGRHCLRGDTSVPALETETELHFVAFLREDSRLVILDGRLPHPVAVDYGDGDFWDAALSLILAVSQEANSCCALALSINCAGGR